MMRMTEDTYVELLQRLAPKLLKKKTKMRPRPISADTRLTVFLRYIAYGKQTEIYNKQNILGGIPSTLTFTLTFTQPKKQ